MRNELANTGKLLADEHVQDAGATESGAQEHLGAAGRVGLGHAPDNGGVVTIGTLPHGGQRRLSLIGGHHTDHLALVGHLHHVVAEHLAGAQHGVLHGNGILVHGDSSPPGSS